MAQTEGGRIEEGLTLVGTLSLLALMLMVFIDVVGRNLFNSPLPWGTEVMEVLLGLMVFVFYPVLARRSGHIVVDLIPVPRGIGGVRRCLGHPGHPHGLGAVGDGGAGWPERAGVPGADIRSLAQRAGYRHVGGLRCSRSPSAS